MSKLSQIKTDCIRVEMNAPDHAAMSRAAESLRRGGLVAFPTETVYGLGADAFNPSAVQKIFDVKGRPADNPLIVHIGDRASLGSLTDSLPAVGSTLASRFWPGPLTLVVNRRSNVPDIVTGGLETVAIRMPNHPVALSLLREFGGGVVAPSANLSGHPSPTNARHVLDDLDGRIDMVLDSGPTAIGVESTVLDITVDPPAILRSGGLPKEVIERVIGPVRGEGDSVLSKRSPGTRYRHYAPKAKVILVRAGDSKGLDGILGKAELRGKRVACLLHTIPDPTNVPEVALHRAPASLEEYAHHLFDFLRQFDHARTEIIIVEGVPEAGLGVAIMDRLRRASAQARAD